MARFFEHLIFTDVPGEFSGLPQKNTLLEYKRNFLPILSIYVLEYIIIKIFALVKYINNF